MKEIFFENDCLPRKKIVLVLVLVLVLVSVCLFYLENGQGQGERISYFEGFGKRLGGVGICDPCNVCFDYKFIFFLVLCFFLHLFQLQQHSIHRFGVKEDNRFSMSTNFRLFVDHFHIVLIKLLQSLMNVINLHYCCVNYFL